MDWKEFTDYTKTLTDMAAHKLGEMTDLAALHLNLKTAQSRLKTLYEDFGRVSYRHFTSEDSLTDEITEAVKQITLLRREIATLKRAIQTKKESMAQEKSPKADGTPALRETDAE
jgi:FtsZ-binding cell division protein ZapB